MAGFSTKTFLKYDDYMTPYSAFEAIKDYIPKNKIIWEPFYGDGKSKEHLLKLGCESVIHEKEDFFKNNKGEIIISNPPFTLKKSVFKRLVELNKPFIIICPSSMINTLYIRELFSNNKDKLQIIIPRKRIQFIKTDNLGNQIREDDRCNFDCFYYCWKMNLKNDITWLN